MSLPPLDICKLEDTVVSSEVDINEVWYSTCMLYDETDNIRLTGNRHFDSRYLDYRGPEGSALHQITQRDEKVTGDWKSHFFIRTTQILLHSFDPSFLSMPVVHSKHCDSATMEECDCWGQGLDPCHEIVLQRLMTMPPKSYISKTYSSLECRSSHFKDTSVLDYYGKLLIPFRYVKYFGEDFKISSVDLLSLLLNTCHFKPKLLPIHCEFMFHNDLYQLYLHKPEDWFKTVHQLFVEFLADIECLEFYWLGGLTVERIDLRISNPLTHIPRLFLEAVLSNRNPKLDSLCISMHSYQQQFYMPKIDSCLNDIAPLFSNSCALDTSIKDILLPTSAHYGGLKKLHIFGHIEAGYSEDILSSIILHQTALEGLETRCVSRSLDLNRVLLTITEISTQPQLQYLLFHRWAVKGFHNNGFKVIFNQFLDANSGCQIAVSMPGHDIIIPPMNSQAVSNFSKSLHFFTNINDISLFGLLFAWLHERKMTQPLQSVNLSNIVTGHNKTCLLPLLSTCKSLSFEYKIITPYLTPEYLKRIQLNKNLSVLRLNNCSLLSLIDEFFKTLSEVYSNSVGLTELSLKGNKLGKLSSEQLRSFFERLFSYYNLEQLSIDLRGNLLGDGSVDLMLRAWEKVGKGKRLKSLLVDQPHHQTKVMEIIQEQK